VLKRIDNDYKAKGVDVLLYVQASGRWGGYGKPIRNVTATEEIELSKHYWIDKYKLSNVIALDTARYLPDSLQDTIAYRGVRLTHTPEFLVRNKLDGGFPTLVLVDRRGIPRARFMGADEEKIRKTIERLLADLTL
jgi:hypothetical protein